MVGVRIIGETFGEVEHVHPWNYFGIFYRTGVYECRFGNGVIARISACGLNELFSEGQTEACVYASLDKEHGCLKVFNRIKVKLTIKGNGAELAKK